MSQDASANPVASQQRPRTDWYQTDAYVSISVFVKGVTQEAANGVVSNDGRLVTVSYQLPNTEDKHSIEFNVSHAVAADGLQLTAKPARLDLRLTKLEPGLRWSVLEGRDNSVLPAPPVAGVAATPDAAGVAAPSASGEQLDRPQPQHKAKNWDAIAKSIEDEKLEGDAALNDLFQKIYKDGTDEQRKAMVKSFTESGGTVLSTNWNEIAKSKVDVKPPDGMEYKKWD